MSRLSPRQHGPYELGNEPFGIRKEVVLPNSPDDGLRVVCDAVEHEPVSASIRFEQRVGGARVGRVAARVAHAPHVHDVYVAGPALLQPMRVSDTDQIGVTPTHKGKQLFLTGVGLHAWSVVASSRSVEGAAIRDPATLIAKIYQQQDAQALIARVSAHAHRQERQVTPAPSFEEIDKEVQNRF